MKISWSEKVSNVLMRDQVFNNYSGSIVVPTERHLFYVDLNGTVETVRNLLKSSKNPFSDKLK